MSTHRKIIHIDMDAFYASVEQLDNPVFRDKPLAVGGTSGKGVIAAASYEARKYGVKSAMSVREALRKCPNLYLTKPNFDRYKSVSRDIRAIFARYTKKIEPLSLDEAFLDVTYSNHAGNSATLIAQQIKNDIYNELNLVASAGVSYNKFLAKIASDQDKPNGLYVITPEEGADFIADLVVTKFFGVGKVMAERLHQKGVYKGSDLLNFTKSDLVLSFGKTGNFLYNIARGIDEREVQSNRIRKSIAAENTYANPVSDKMEAIEKLMTTFETFWSRYSQLNAKGKSLTLKVKFSDFKTVTRSVTEENVITDKEYTRKKVLELFENEIEFSRSIRLMGVAISNLDQPRPIDKNSQLVIKF